MHRTRFANALADTGLNKAAALLTATRAGYAAANYCEWPAGCETDVDLLAGSRPYVFTVTRKFATQNDCVFTFFLLNTIGYARKQTGNQVHTNHGNSTCQRLLGTCPRHSI
jgi:hypothetical protein